LDSSLGMAADAITEAIGGVDEAHVQKRLALASTPDVTVKLGGLAFNQNGGADLVIDSWRHFVADTEWTIPGMGKSVKPDCIRRPAKGW
jgi:hypothetical protein